MHKFSQEELAAFRRPGKKECDDLYEYYKAWYGRFSRFLKRLSTTLCVLGVIFMGGYLTMGIFAIVIGVLFIAGGFFCTFRRKLNEIDLDVIRKGDFLVAPGRIFDLSVNTNNIGVYNAKFRGQKGIEFEGTFTVRREESEEGTSALLVYVSPEKVKDGIISLVTPYMLSPEGRKKSIG